MTTVTLVYPYFHSPSDNSSFRHPPLGLGYIAAYLKQHNISVELVDCTFISQEEALEKIRRSNPKIIGIYSMFSMKSKSLKIAKLTRKNCELLVTGGPLPTLKPEEYLNDFDIVVIGEGEETMLELVQNFENRHDFSKVSGIAYKDKGKIKVTPPREQIKNLDSMPFPARELFDNKGYKEYYFKKFGYTTTTIMSSRGCPFDCDFCSRPVFGNKLRTRSPANVVDEMETVVELGYDRIFFSDDCFTLSRKGLIEVCNEIIRRGVKIDWECLSRVDTVDREVTQKMKQAGCVRVFFGIESGNESVLALMNKRISLKQAEEAVHLTKQSGIQVGAFFIVGYPGENNETILDTVRFASSLPLDYLSFTMPYPIPGTPLYDRMKEDIIFEDWEEPKNRSLVKHKLMFESPFSEAKLKFAILKARIQSKLRKHLGTNGYKIIGTPFEQITDFTFKHLL
ncbi:MAG: radical SAM protein [Candidatus Freyarchaeum deiterrae]